MQNLSLIKQIPILRVAELLGIKHEGKKAIECFKGHGKQTPCFSFSLQNNFFKCFSCGIAGTQIDLVMHYNNCSVQEAIKYLSIKFPEYSKNESSIIEEKKKKEEPKFPKTPFHSIFQDFLNSLDTEQALDYLCNTRKIARHIAIQSSIKCIPANFTYKYLLKKYTENDLEAAGLFSSGNSALEHFPLIIPNFNVFGKIISLQARALCDNATQRYLFLKHNKMYIYNSKALYNALTTDSTIFIVEGVIDLLSILTANNTKNVIALQSTNNTSIYTYYIMRLLAQVNVVLCCDNDKAGKSFVYKFVNEYSKHTSKTVKLLRLRNDVNYTLIHNKQALQQALMQ